MDSEKGPEWLNCRFFGIAYQSTDIYVPMIHLTCPIQKDNISHVYVDRLTATYCRVGGNCIPLTSKGVNKRILAQHEYALLVAVKMVSAFHNHFLQISVLGVAGFYG